MRRLIRTEDFDLLVGEGVDKYDLLRELLNLRGLGSAVLSKNAEGGVVVLSKNAKGGLVVDNDADSGHDDNRDTDVGERGAIFVSVSDCGELAVAALSLAGPIGVDIQGGLARPRVARKFFSSRELLLDFNLVWARKEAYAKWLGTGLTNASLAVDTCDLDFYEFNLVDDGFGDYYIAVFAGKNRAFDGSVIEGG